VRDAKSAADAAERSARASERIAHATAELSATASTELEMLKAQFDRRPELELTSLNWNTPLRTRSSLRSP
jgi:hypothetical protein